MPSPEQPSRQPSGDSPDKVCRSFLAADPQPAIRAASAPKLRAVLISLTRHLCDRARSQASDFLTGAPCGWPGPCATGSGMRAGFELYHQLCRAVTANWLNVTGFGPAQAAAEPGYHAGIPSLAAAGRDRMRGTLLMLTDRIGATTDDAGTSVTLPAATQLPDDLRDAGTAAIGLYRHAVLIKAAGVWYCLHDELGTGPAPALPPFSPLPGALFREAPGPMTAAQISTRLPAPGIGHALSQLPAAGPVTATRTGRTHRYQAVPGRDDYLAGPVAAALDPAAVLRTALHTPPGGDHE